MPRALWGVLWTLAVAVVLSGCFRSDQDRALTTEIGKSGLDLVSYTGTTRGAYIWPADGGRHVCAEPPPDLGLTTARELAANLKAAAEAIGGVGAPSLEAGGTAKLSSAAIELAGRSQSCSWRASSFIESASWPPIFPRRTRATSCSPGSTKRFSP